ncbi:hypothetical protein C8Q72DRAFT_485893 [Fomitopsis betulina]|nr:hypothetical protein C8Q72DRAFT_485893 [Fomitopsis betulina]
MPSTAATIYYPVSSYYFFWSGWVPIWFVSSPLPRNSLTNKNHQYHCAYLSSARSQLHGCRVISNIPDLIIPRSTLPHMCAIKVVDNHAQPLEIALRLSNMLAEVLVVAATWRATFELARQTGSIYFVILLSLNIAAAALWTKNSFQDVSLFFHTFSTIVLSRFFLNLRAAASPMPTSHIFTQAAQEFSFSLRFGIGEETDNEGESYTGELEHDEEAEHDIDILP